MSSKDPSFDIMGVLLPSTRAIWNEMRKIARPELTVAQFRILTRLNVSPHTNKQLADWIGISAASMCRTVDVLVKRDFVTRQSALEDRREVTLTLTSKGRKKYKGIERGTQNLLKKKLSALSAKDRKQLQSGLAMIRKVFLTRES